MDRVWLLAILTFTARDLNHENHPAWDRCRCGDVARGIGLGAPADSALASDLLAYPRSGCRLLRRYSC